jgi:hypothetical protein
MEMGYRYELQGRVKFSREKLVCLLWILKWPFIDELAWKGPNCPDEKALQHPCEPMWYCLS